MIISLCGNGDERGNSGNNGGMPSWKRKEFGWERIAAGH